MYVLEGPAVIGNIFGFFGKDVPPGKFVIVENGEYANGGHGPSQAVMGIFDTRESAEARMREAATA